MSSSSREKLVALEASVDAHYMAKVPKTRSWELTISHLLFAHAASAMASLLQEFQSPPPGPWSPSVESRKHGLMHAVRMLHTLESRPIRGVRAHVDESLVEWAIPFLSLGLEYDAVICGFTLYHAGKFSVAELSDDRVLFVPIDPFEAAYDFADHFLHSPQATQEQSQTFAEHLRGLIERTGSLSLSSLLASPDMSSALMQTVSAMHETSWQLPTLWSYKGTPVAKLRQFWTALWLVGTSALGSGFGALREPVPTWKPVLWMRTAALASCISKLTELSEVEVRTILEWHVYDRSKTKSDVALTPFVQTDAEHVITSPELLTTSRFERNFYANAARTNSSEIDDTSHLLAPQMASELAMVFRDKGYLAATEVPYHSSRGDGDIDLLVWAPNECTLMALELKWFVAPADYREVLNLADKAAEPIREQLPKYRCALAEDLTGLLPRAFGAELRTMPRLLSVGLVMRNYVGHASLRKYPFWFAPEAALLQVSGLSSTLTELIANMENFSWLPRLGKDYEVFTTEFVSPGGVKLGVPAYRVPVGKPV